MPPDRQEARAAAKTGSGRRRRRGGGEIADWSSVDAEALRQLVANVTSAGAAITFGYTRDRGAYALHFADGSDRYKDYVPATDDVQLVIAELLVLWRDD